MAQHDYSEYPHYAGTITIKYEKQTKMKKVKLNEQDLKKAYNKGCPEVKQALKNLYPNVKFEKKLPNSWIEYCEMMNDFDYISISILDHNGFTNIIDYKYLALRKLELLRDFYNDGWKADWEEISYKYIICKDYDKIVRRAYEHNYGFLSFKTEDLRDKFLSNFKDLILQAEDLI